MKDIIMLNNLLIFIRFRIQWPILIKNSSTDILLCLPLEHKLRKCSPVLSNLRIFGAGYLHIYNL